MDDVGDTSTVECWYFCVHKNGHHIGYYNSMYTY